MNTLFAILPGTPQEMRVRIHNVLEILKLDYIDEVDAVRMIEMIIDDYPQHPDEQYIMLEGLLAFTEDLVKSYR